MKLPKHALNKYHSGLQECIRSRKEWMHYYIVKLRWGRMKREVSYFMSFQKPIMSLLLFIIYLPTNIFKLIENIKTNYDLKELEKEIEVLEKELLYVDQLRWNKKNNEDLKLLK